MKVFFIIFFLYVKMVNNYYQKHKERLRKEARERCQNLSEEEKKKASVLSHKQKLPEYRRNYHLTHKK